MVDCLESKEEKQAEDGGKSGGEDGRWDQVCRILINENSTISELMGHLQVVENTMEEEVHR